MRIGCSFVSPAEPPDLVLETEKLAAVRVGGSAEKNSFGMLYSEKRVEIAVGARPAPARRVDRLPCSSHTVWNTLCDMRVI